MSKLNELELAIELTPANFVGGYSEWPQEGDNYVVVEFNTLEEKENMMQNFINYKYVDGSFVLDTSRASEINLKGIKGKFQRYRIRVFKKWDILKSNVAVGLVSALTDEEIDWYQSMLSFPDSISLSTTEDDYPTTPARVEAY